MSNWEGGDTLRVEVRKELSLENPNLKEISATDKIALAIKSKLYESKFYKNSVKKKMDAEQRKRLQRISQLKESLLVRLYAELTEDTTLKKKGLHTKYVRLIVRQSYADILDEVLTHKEFLPYEIGRVPENSDIRLAFPDMPIILNVERKMLGDD